jgi:hypothetical protein
MVMLSWQAFWRGSGDRPEAEFTAKTSKKLNSAESMILP